MTKKITVVIPVNNEEMLIESLVDECSKYSDDVLVVIAKKSLDNTKDIVKRIGVKYLIDNGYGKGDGMRCALDEIKDGIVVFIDADGSHNVSDIPKLIEPIKENKADMVIASRILGGSDELCNSFENNIRKFFTVCIGKIISWRFKKKIYDTQNGFRAIDVKKIKKLNLISKHTEIETEICIKFFKSNYRILEVPSFENKRKYGKSNIILLRDMWKYIWICLKYLW